MAYIFPVLEEKERIQNIDIDGMFGEYAVTDKGKIWSYRSGMFLRPWKQKKGYLCVSLVGSKVYKVHRVVATAFIKNNNPEKYTTVNHLDGVKTNNNAVNLEWTNNSGNIKHAWDTGLIVQSEKSKGWNTSRRIFESGDILQIRKMFDSGETCSGISRKYSVSPGTIRQIVNRKSYKEVV